MNLIERVKSAQNLETYHKLNWEGTFSDYLALVQADPRVARNAFQRVYDMINAFGSEEHAEHRERLVHYKFFRDPFDGGRDAIYGLDRTVMKIVDFFKAAAQGYGPERRVLLLHGPVGSSKSTIARLLKKGLEHYSRTDEGALYTLQWREVAPDGHTRWVDDAMHGEPLLLIPPEFREEFTSGLAGPYPVRLEGDLSPASRQYYREALAKYDGDWSSVVQNEVRVRRLILSEKDRVGIGTFQPKDEKNQDSTELTGDINYRKIAEYGSDSDPRAFNFDGELNIANRGIVEFIEILKLDVAFLYDLLTASQEHKIKSKKFAQTDIDEVILGHSVAGDTPIPYRHNGTPAWTSLENLYARFHTNTEGLEVLSHDFETGQTRWTKAKTLIRHAFSGQMLTTSQKWGSVETTPNHSIYSRDGQPFYPFEQREVMAVRVLEPETFQSPATIDGLEGVEGFVQSDVLEFAGGARMTRPANHGWARLNLPRHATQIQARYDLDGDADALKDLITVLVWYATEGHVNGRNGGIVISQADPIELERVRAAYARITTGKGSIDAGAKTDSAWRLYLGSQAVAKLVTHHCGELSYNKRLPDFLFGLPRAFLQHAFDELMRTDGSRKLSGELERTASDAYRERYFEYKTISPMLAAQVGTLATLLGHDYSVYRAEREDRLPTYRVRFVSGSGKPGGRHTSFEARLEQRPTTEEWVYDIECLGLHNFVCGVGNIVCHNTNEPEYRKLQNNEFMEALRDRTIKIDVPYITKLTDEIRIYERDFANKNGKRRAAVFLAPHTIEIAAMWAVLTRLEPPQRANLTLLQKLKLYDGKSLPGFTEENVKELKSEAKREGMEGISPRYVQDKISNAIVSTTEASVNPFMVLNELEDGLKHHGLVSDDKMRERYRQMIGVVREEYEQIIKNEVQRAISADEEAITRLAANYIDNVKAYTQGERVRNRYTGQADEPNERLMRSIEEKIEIPESRKDDFRREIMNYIGALAVEGKTFSYRTNERLRKALELKLFEDQKDTIRLTSLVTGVVDQDTQAKIDVVKARLIRDFGYDDASATDVLQYVASIFARGDVKG